MGDEGKGKIVDIIAPDYDYVARFQGGPNAGHTLVIEGKKLVLHTIPSGIIHKNTINVVGTGTVIDPVTLFGEVDFLADEGISIDNRLIISDKAHLIMPSHKMLDKYFELSKGDLKIGSTLRGIGPTYQDKYARIGLRTEDIFKSDFEQLYNDLKDEHLRTLISLGLTDEDLSVMTSDEQQWFSAVERLRKLQIQVIEDLLNDSLAKGSKVLAEGAQGTLLDVTFGSYPFVTSSNTISASACIGLGIPPNKINRVIGIFKAYMTRVGSGPFPTELLNPIGEKLGVHGHEFGATTDENVVAVVRSPTLKKNDRSERSDGFGNYQSDVLNCLPEFSTLSTDGQLKNFDSWTEDLSELSHFNELPDNFKTYLQYIEEQCGVPINTISTGPQRSEIINR